MAIKIDSLSFFFFFIILLLVTSTSTSFPMTSSPITTIQEEGTSGQWNLLHPSIGISAMHMQLLHNNKIVIFDRTDFGPSNLSLPPDNCRVDPNDVALKFDCTAHSLIYDVSTNSIRPLKVQTDTWCSSGAVNPDGELIQTGGYNDGERMVRTFTPCDNEICDWVELDQYLYNRRWYASNQILPDGRVIVVGGRNVFTYEFFPKTAPLSSPSSYFMSFLKETRDVKDENNLYPFLHLLPDGNLFIFANRRSVSFDYKANRVVKQYPIIPGEKRNYPSTGSSVLLPIKLTGDGGVPVTEVLICGGAPQGAYRKAEKEIYVSASKTCGRINVFDPKPNWTMETMPMPRVMSDMLLLPTGDVIILNGASNGTAGWEDAVNPVLNPVLYLTNEKNPVRRFVTVLSGSKIARMYHSSAVLIPDGRILVGGSNPHRTYNFSSINAYPTELSLEAFSPYYLSPQYAPVRPTILTVETEERSVSFNQRFSVTFVLSIYRPDMGMSVNIVAPSFTTHSIALNQRMVILNVIETVQLSTFAYKVVVDGPTSANVAPPGYYMLFLVHAGIPGTGFWVKVR